MKDLKKAVPEVSLTLAKKGVVAIKCSFEALARYELQTDIDPLTIAWLAASPKQLLTFLWCALGGEKSGIKLEEMSDELGTITLADVREVILSTLKSAELTEEQKKILRGESPPEKKAAESPGSQAG